MVRRFPLPIWAGRFSDVNSLLVSAVCHLTVLVALALVAAAGGTGAPQVMLALDVSEAADMPANDDDALQHDVVQVEVAADDAAALGPVRLFDDAALATSDFGPMEALAEIVDKDSGAAGTALTNFGDSAGGSGQTGKAATEFFGIGGYGQKFVYVVDCSGSMRENGKFERAVYELLQSIEQLQSDQEYSIIFYNQSAYPMDEPGLVLATEQQFEKTRNWISLVQPQGGTVPLPALLMALKMKPNAIFFLSDGLFDPSTGRKIHAFNRGKTRRIPIHTVAFVNRETEGLMQRIAGDSGGKYRFVQ
ncbi:MAG: hypothetical protein WD468_07460 [Pirellulales bacterium]